MDVRFYVDPDTDEPHIYQHGIMEDEVLQVLRAPGQDLPGSRASRMKIGKTVGGRYLKVIYTRDSDGPGLFVITAYELGENAKRAFRRRQRRKPR